MFKSLFAKLTLTLFALFILLSLLTATITFFASDLYQQEVMQKLNSEVANHIVKEIDLLKDDRANHPALKKLFHSLMVLNPSLEIYLLDHEGEILAFSAPPWKVIRLAVDVAPIKRYLSEATPLLPLKGDDPRDFDRYKVFSAATVPFENQADGYLYVILGGEEYDSITDKINQSYILSSSILTTAIGLIIIFLMGLFIFANLTRRLKKLANQIQQFEQFPQQKPNFPLRSKHKDEIEQLATAFQSMALKIHHQLDTLKTTDQVRRDLVANVSHDLRTPLATLQGYIETLLIKEDSLSKQDRHHYLQTAIKHCTHLNRLVSELFELARLDASETRPQLESFNLAELVEDVVQQFSLSGQQKQISLQTQYSSTTLFVYADISLIERVLENLLENALRFVAEKGVITVTLIEQQQQIQVHVCDNGIGIPAHELELIFDRFYQLDKNRKTESSKGGLGLAIVKRILELHNSKITVKSIPQHETTFSFNLSTHAAQ